MRAEMEHKIVSQEGSPERTLKQGSSSTHLRFKRCTNVTKNPKKYLGGNSVSWHDKMPREQLIVGQPLLGGSGTVQSASPDILFTAFLSTHFRITVVQTLVRPKGIVRHLVFAICERIDRVHSKSKVIGALKLNVRLTPSSPDPRTAPHFLTSFCQIKVRP